MTRRLPCAFLSAAALLALAPPAPAGAHDVPADVTVVAMVRPEAHALRLLVRVPLQAMRDVEFPLRGPGFLDFAAPEGALDAALRDAATRWITVSLRLREDGHPLPVPAVVAVRASRPSDRSFGSWETAAAHVRSPPLPPDTDLPWAQAMLDVALEVPVASASARFAVAPAFARLGMRTTTVIRFFPPGGGERVFQFGGDPGLVRLDPRWHQAALTFLRLGLTHILQGLDHLLFLLCLVAPFRRVRPLGGLVTAFTVAHSITLGASALGFAPTALWFPALVEVLVAASIVWLAFENIAAAAGGAGSPSVRRRWVMAFGFGLVHGFAFSFALGRSLQLAGTHVLGALLAFNTGVELGQLAALVVLVPTLALLFGRVVQARVGVILLSALVAHTAWHWLAERFGVLRQYRFRWPALDAALADAVLRAAMLLLIVGGALWLLRELLGRVGVLGATPSDLAIARLEGEAAE